jgi:hypothetical protein
MNAKRLFEDDDLLFAEEDEANGDRTSHVELRLDAPAEATSPAAKLANESQSGFADPASTQRELPSAGDYFSRIPKLAVSADAMKLLVLDHREGFLVSRVDGKSTIETILDVSAMSAEEALMILESLVERGVLVIPR